MLSRMRVAEIPATLLAVLGDRRSDATFGRDTATFLGRKTKQNQRTMASESGHCIASQRMSVLGHNQTFCTAARLTLFDHLVSKLLQLRRYIEAKRFGGPEVDDQLELGW
jgi:hypothetical protein